MYSLLLGSFSQAQSEVHAFDDDFSQAVMFEADFSKMAPAPASANTPTTGTTASSTASSSSTLTETAIQKKERILEQSQSFDDTFKIPPIPKVRGATLSCGCIKQPNLEGHLSAHLGNRVMGSARQLCGNPSMPCCIAKLALTVGEASPWVLDFNAELSSLAGKYTML